MSSRWNAFLGIFNYGKLLMKIAFNMHKNWKLFYRIGQEYLHFYEYEKYVTLFCKEDSHWKIVNLNQFHNFQLFLGD